jgi:hypothetical protein
MAEAAFNKKKAVTFWTQICMGHLYTSGSRLEILERFKMCWFRGMEKIVWTDRVRNEVLQRVKEEMINLQRTKRRKADWIGHILCRNCLLKHDILESKAKFVSKNLNYISVLLSASRRFSSSDFISGHIIKVIAVPTTEAYSEVILFQKTFRWWVIFLPCSLLFCSLNLARCRYRMQNRTSNHYPNVVGKAVPSHPKTYPFQPSKSLRTFNPFQSNFSATRILPSCYLFWAGKRLMGYL